MNTTVTTPAAPAAAPADTLTRTIAAGLRPLLVGPPGCGKTARIAAAAAATGRELVVMRASLSERVDFSGALVPNMQTGVTEALPLELLANLQTTTVPTVLLLDDLGQAPMDVQAATMRFFDAGYLADAVLIAGATNRAKDAAGATRLCEPLRSRFHVAFNIPTADTTADDMSTGMPIGTWNSPNDDNSEVSKWCDWAMAAGACPEIIAWHRSTGGRTLYAWTPNSDPSVRMPDFRSWETVMRMWNHGLRDLPTVAAAIGRPAAAEFLAFAALANSIPTPDQIFMDPSGAIVPTEGQASYLVATMVAAAAEPGNVPAALVYLNRMNRVYGAFLAKDLLKKFGPAVSGHPAWVAWYTDNADLFTVNA